MNARAVILYLFHTQEQDNSYEAQVDYFAGYIKQRVDWEFVKVYWWELIRKTTFLTDVYSDEGL